MNFGNLQIIVHLCLLVLDEKKYSLEEAGQAHARLESGQAMGKVVVEN